MSVVTRSGVTHSPAVDPKWQATPPKPSAAMPAATSSVSWSTATGTGPPWIATRMVHLRPGCPAPLPRAPGDVDDLAGDGGRLVCDQEDDHAGDLLGLDRPVERVLREPVGDLLLGA